MGSPSLPPPGQPAPLKDGEFVPSRLVQDASFLTRGVQPPSPLYVGVDDTIGLLAMCNATAQPLLLVAGRFLRASDGVVVPFFKQFIFPNVAYTLIERQFQLGEGYLLSMCVSTSSNAFGRGQMFCRAWLQRGGGAIGPNNPIGQLLVADYINMRAPAAWPGGLIIHPADGLGNMIQNATLAPPAGSDFSLVIGTTVRRKVHSMNATLVTSAAVANRLVGLNAGALRVPAVAAQTASQTVTYRWIQGTDPYTGADGSKVMGIPAGYITGNTSGFAVVTTNIDAADQWSAIAFDYEEWLDF